MDLTNEQINKLNFFQKNEITEYRIYKRLAAKLRAENAEVLSEIADEESSHALTSALYTGSAYLITVFILILPFLMAANYFIALGFTLVFALLIIMGFNYYIAVAKDLPFKKRFAEMALLSMGVAVFTFGISYLIRIAFGVDV